MKTQAFTKKFLLTLLCVGLSVSPTLAKPSEQTVEQFVKQHALTMLRLAASTSALMLDEELTKKQTACIDKVINTAGNQLVIQFNTQEQKAIKDLLATSVGKSMQKYNQKITSIASEGANLFSFADEWQQRLDNIKSDKERDIAHKANPILQSIVAKNDTLIANLPHKINQECGTNLPAQSLQ